MDVTIHDVSIICVTETLFKSYMDDKNLSIEGFSQERKDRCDGRTVGGVACYIRNSFMYKRLSNLEETELEVIWLKIMPKKLPRKFSCILISCIYFTQMTEYAKMREHVITCVHSVIRKHPECGVILTGDFNQMNDSFLKTHYKFSQIVKVATRGQAILDKIWTNMNMGYSKPVTVAELGTSDHNMVLLKRSSKRTLDTGNMTCMPVKGMGAKEKATFELALSLIKWEPLYRLDSCNEKYV